VPIGLAALVIGARYIPENRAAQARPVDIVGTVLLSAALFAGVLRAEKATGTTGAARCWPG
ncbi:MFS transporter, partial [Mycolicibacterium farcinogenes]|nr:MFS transporter [Mycolicibacterium farcinogenes]